MTKKEEEVNVENELLWPMQRWKGKQRKKLYLRCAHVKENA